VDGGGVRLLLNSSAGVCSSDELAATKQKMFSTQQKMFSVQALHALAVSVGVKAPFLFQEKPCYSDGVRRSDLATLVKLLECPDVALETFKRGQTNVFEPEKKPKHARTSSIKVALDPLKEGQTNVFEPEKKPKHARTDPVNGSSDSEFRLEFEDGVLDFRERELTESFPYFQALFRNEFIETKLKKVNLTKVCSKHAFKVLFVLTGLLVSDQVDLVSQWLPYFDMEALADLIDLSDYFALVQLNQILKSHCEKLLLTEGLAWVDLFRVTKARLLSGRNPMRIVDREAHVTALVEHLLVGEMTLEVRSSVFDEVEKASDVSDEIHEIVTDVIVRAVTQ
jgi:hypothetical protein